MYVERYEAPLQGVFSRQHKLQLEWRVELALLKALGATGRIPVEAHDEIKMGVKGWENSEMVFC